MLSSGYNHSNTCIIDHRYYNISSHKISADIHRWNKVIISAAEKGDAESCQADQNDYSLLDLSYGGNLCSLLSMKHK